MSKKGNAHSQDLLKYQKLYNWCRTLITSGVIKNKDKFPSENILQKKFGYMVALQDNHIVPVPLTEVAGKLKAVPPGGELVKQARALGLSMGD